MEATGVGTPPYVRLVRKRANTDNQGIMDTRSTQPTRPGAGLSEREREVLSLLGHGLTNAQIAQRLFLSPNTIKSHVSHVLHKLGLPNRTEAALFAAREGLVGSAG
jgi:DNA-binding NarL/FixJ family response regulator